MIPKSIYKTVRSSGSSNLDPVVVNPRLAMQTSRQVTAYLLCSECEQRFNKNGEDWTLKHCFHTPGKFLIHDFLSRAPGMVLPDNNGRVISALDVPAIDLDKLVYFAVSVFWRASVHSWILEDHQLKRFSFGEKYESEFRLYLLGEANFPNNASLLILVSDNPTPFETAIFPYGQRIDSYHRYKFAIPGFVFLLYVGKVPKEIREMCIPCSPYQPIYFGPLVDEEIKYCSLLLMENTNPSDKLSKEWQRRRFES